MSHRNLRVSLGIALVLAAATSIIHAQPAAAPPPGFTPAFNGKDMAGWKGLAGNPLTRAKMTPEQLAEAQRKADELIAQHWKVENGELVSDGKGPNLCTAQPYGDFEMYVDWKIPPKGDSGIYLRGSPQVQIWDAGNAGEKRNGADKGSGALWNNQKNERFPLVCADNPPGQWNTFLVRMIGERVTVKLNGKLVTDNVVMENYWDRPRPIFPREQIELQTHGGEIRFRNVYLREIPPEEANAELAKTGADGFTPLFNGKDLEGWIGAVENYQVVNGALMCKPGKGGNLLTKEQSSDFIVRFEFKLPPGGNNGLVIRTPPQGDGAYVGMELQVLDDTAEKYKGLKEYQYHGSIYGVVPAQRGHLRSVGQWNFQEVIAQGGRIQVMLNGTKIVDADISKIDKTLDGREHLGLKRERGHIGFAGHSDPVEFRNVALKVLKP